MITEIVSVTPVSGASVVQPDESTTLTNGNVSVTFPAISRARTFQAVLSVDDGPCSDLYILLACFRLDIYTAEGEPESDVRLIFPARITIALDSDTISDLGGASVLLQTHALGGLKFLVSNVGPGDWRDIHFRFQHIEPDGSTTVTATLRRLGGYGALTMDADILEMARAQLGVAVVTPTRTPMPTATRAPMPTAIPTATPESDSLPEVGDTPPSLTMVLTLMAAGALVAFAGFRVISNHVRQRPRE